MRAATAREQRTRSIDHAAAATRSSTANDSEGEVVAAGHEKHRTTTAADKVAAADRIDTVVRATQRGRAAMQVEAARIGPGCMTVTVHKVQHTAAREARKAHARITLPRAKQHRTDQAHEDQVHEDQAHYTQALAAEARANRSRAAQARAEYRQARAREVAFAFQQPQSIPQAQAFQQAQEIRALQYIYARQQAIAAQQAHAVQRANVVQQAIYFTAAATVSEPTAVGAETMNKSHVKHFVDSYRRHLAEHMRTNRGTEPFPDVVMQQVRWIQIVLNRLTPSNTTCMSLSLSNASRCLSISRLHSQTRACTRPFRMPT